MWGRGREVLFIYRSAILLWAAHLVSRAAMFAFGFKAGRLGGVEFLGVMATIFMVVWVAGSISHLGLPEWGLFRSAKDCGRGVPASPELRSGHLLYLGTGLVSFSVIMAMAPWVGGVPEFSHFSRWLVVGAALQHSGNFGISCLRGLGRAYPETCAHLGSAAVLVVGSYLATETWHMGVVFAVSGACYGIVGLMSAVLVPALRPHFGRMHSVRRSVARSLPYLAVGLGTYGLSSMDLLVARILCSPGDVGILQSSTVIIRGAAAGPWMLTTLVLHHFEKVKWRFQANRFWAVGVPGVVLAPSFGLALVVIVAVWLLLPFVAWGYGLSLDEIETTTKVALGTTPIYYVTVTLVVLSAMRFLRRTVITVMAALAISLVSTWLLTPPFGLAGAILGSCIGQVCALVLLWRLPFVDWIAGKQEAPAR